MQISTSFTEAGVSAQLSVPPGKAADYAVSGTFTGFVTLQRSENGGATWETVRAGAADTGFSGQVRNESQGDVRYRFKADDTDGSTPMTGTAVTTLGDANLDAEKIILNAGVLSKAGTSSGWTTAAVDSKSLATLAASLSSKVLVVPITGLKVGDKITGFHLIGQVESGGNNVTIDAALTRHTAAAADVTDTTVASMTQLVVAADTVLSKTNTRKAALDEVVAENTTHFLLITGTTTGSTDIALQGVAVEVVRA